MRQTERLMTAVSEYKCILPSPRSKRSRPMNPERLVRELCRSHDWTDSGARAVVSLAEGYGSFMLRNALALAIVLEKEDGDLRY
jgi:hypothetical protein